VTRVADPSTMNDYVDWFLNPDTVGVDLSTENAGGVWTDKSVFAANSIPSELTGATSELDTKINVDNTGDNFLVALSAIASNKEIMGYSTRPTDTMFVLDLSGSMGMGEEIGYVRSNNNYTAVTDYDPEMVAAMIQAANDAIHRLLTLNNHNRVGVVLYSGNTQVGASNESTAQLILPLGRYDAVEVTKNGVTTYEYLEYATTTATNTLYEYRNYRYQSIGTKTYTTKITASVKNGLKTEAGAAVADVSKDTVGGTYIQNGLYKAWLEFSDADTVIADGSIQAGTTRMPIMVLMSDGAPTTANHRYTGTNGSMGTSTTGTGQSTTDNGIPFLTQLTAAWTRAKMEEHYEIEPKFYTLGLDTGTEYDTSVLNPSNSNNQLKNYWNKYKALDDGESMEMTLLNTNSIEQTHKSDVTKDALVNDMEYVDEYFPAKSAQQMINAFESIVNEIILQSKYYPTYVEKDHDHDGYITFTDKIGGYMEVTDIHGIVIGDTLFSGEKLARGFSEGGIFGSLENPSTLGDNLVWSVKERLHISDTTVARTLLNNAYNYDQMGITADGSWSNYIGWYSDAQGNYLDFWDESLTTDVPTGATHIIKSYVMLGQTDAAHGISAEDMMYASIRVTTELDDYDQDGIAGETFLTWQIPASLIPTITYEVTVEANDAGEITGVEKVELENANVKPIRLLYEVALREDIHEWNIADEVSDGYRDSTANKDAGYVFYTNQWKKEDGTTDTTRNTYSHFEPSVQNEWYYYTEDAIIYTNESGTKYTGDSAPSTSGTYYRAYQVYEKLETGAYRTHTHYEQISAQSLAVAEKSGDNWVIPKGTVFRFWDPFQDTKSANNTQTHTYSEYPTIVHDDASGNYYAYDVLGNNGKLIVTPATGIQLTKTVSETVDGVSNIFTFVIAGGTGNATLLRMNDQGEVVSRQTLTFVDGEAEFTISTDETVKIIGLTDGVTYTVTEKGNDNYNVSSVTVNGQEVSGTAAEITAISQTIQSAAFVNAPKGYGDLYISKTISSEHTIPDAIKGQSFQIRADVGTALAGEELTVKMTDMEDPTQDISATYTVTEGGYIDLVLKDTQTAKILHLPEGTVVTVTETLTDEQQDYFTYTVKTRDHSGAEEEDDKTVTIYKDMRATASVINEYSPVPVELKIDFDGTKNFNAEKMTEDASFTFRLQQYVNGAWTDVDTASVTIPAGTKDATERFDFDTLELTFEKEGTYSCQILEDIGTNDDVTYDRSVYTFSVVVTDDGTGKLQAEIVANVESGDEANFGATQGNDGWNISTTFNNEYHTTATNIDIQKVIVDNANAGKTGQGFIMESYNASVDADGVWTLGSFIRSATTDAEGEVRLARNYDNTDFENDTDDDNQVTYHFIIKERNTGANAWTYDNTHYLVSVVLTRTESEEGTESIAANFTIHKGVAGENGTFTAGEAVTVSGDTATITFTNTFDPNDTTVDLNIVPTVTKHLEGRGLNAGEFTFKIYNDGDRQNALATGTNDADGDVNFDKALTFSKVGIYELDVVEEKGSLGGVTYDETVYDMVVVVTEQDGVLAADYFFEDSTTKTVTFRNSYDADDTEIILEGTKTLTGKPMLNAEFRFTLTEVTDATGATVVPDGVTRTAANNPDDDGDQTASFAFGAIPYTTTGEYYYLIAEEGAGTTVNGVTYTSQTYVVKVTVSDPGDGVLTATSQVVTGGEALSFTNTYIPQPTSADLSSSKQLTGRVMAEGEFAFTLTEKTDDTYATDKTDGVKETVKNDANGNIAFSTLHFDETGDYYYVIEEAKGSAGGVDYDETEYHIHISVTDDHRGKLVATTEIVRVTVEDGQQVTTEVGAITFHNTYTIDGDGELILSGTKVLDGERPEDLQAEEFSFGLFDSTGAQLEVVKNDAEGNFSFSALTYDETDVGQTYTYQIREILPEANGQKLTNYLGVAYDTTVYNVEVTIADDGEGGITVSYTVNNVDAGPVEFTNTYSVNGHDHVVLSGTKELSGRDIVKDEFAVGLFDGSTKIAEAKVAADGSFTFGELEALTYDADDLGNTYTYTVRELRPVVDGVEQSIYEGVTYDTTIYTVVINVVDDGQGNPDASYTVNGSAFTHITFHNAYNTEPAEHTLNAKKIYEKGLKGDDFTFRLEGDIDGTEVFQTKKNAADGTIVFDKLTFTNAGTYTFTITEIDQVLGFINYSKEVYTVQITVTDNKVGQLEVTAVKIVDSTGTDSDTIEFENIYVLDGDARLTLTGTKTLTGYRTQVQAGEFSFGLYDSEGELIEQVSNAADGSFRFKALEYTEADAGKTYTYTVKEILPVVDGKEVTEQDGRTYDTTVYTVLVTVSDNDHGGIIVTHTVNGVDSAPISFANRYNVKEAEVNLKGKKTYDKGLQGGDFEFILEGEIDGEKIKQTKENAADGSITFDKLTFTQAGTYEFTIKEVDEALGFIEYSKTIYTVKVEVTDDNKGNLIPTVTVNDKTDGEILFENVYKYIDDNDEVTIHGTKKLTGYRTQVQAGEFSFGLYEGETEIEVVAVKADGTFAFSTLTYGVDDIGKHTYTVKEIIPAEAVANVYQGRTYDPTVYTVTVEVVDDNTGNIVATAKINDGAVSEIAFTNAYNVKEAEVNLKGKKTYDKGLQGGDFEFILEGEIDGEKIKQTKENAADGSITFDKLTFTQAGTYEFTIKEVDEALGFIEYSKTIYTVKVEVTDDNKGNLIPTVTVNDKTDGEILFENSYKLDGENELTLRGSKTLVGRELAVGEFSFGLYNAAGELIETVSNDASGAFAFSKLTYHVEPNEVQQHTYTVKEIAGSDPSITYDETIYTVEVTVKDDNQGGTDLQYTINGAADTNLVFSNSYTPPADVVASINILKEVENKTEPGIGLNDFTFLLTDGTQTLSVTSDEAGKAGFQLTYGADDIGKTFVYEVSEKKGSVAGVQYDTTVHTITVEVGQNADGTLNLTMNGQKTNSVTVSFKNIYSKPTTPVTGDDYPVIMLFTLMLISAAGMVVVLLNKPGKKGRYSA